MENEVPRSKRRKPRVKPTDIWKHANGLSAGLQLLTTDCLPQDTGPICEGRVAVKACPQLGFSIRSAGSSWTYDPWWVHAVGLCERRGTCNASKLSPKDRDLQGCDPDTAIKRSDSLVASRRKWSYRNANGCKDTVAVTDSFHVSVRHLRSITAPS